MVQLTILCFCLPTLLLAAPVEDAFKQPMTGGLMRNDESLWMSPAAGSGVRPSKMLDSLGGSAFGHQKRFDTLGGRYFGGPYKRNFDEIDNTGFGAFSKRDNPAGFDAYVRKVIERAVYKALSKRNFDEIDNVGMTFKRNFDEIDNAGWETFAKRSQ